MLLFVVVVFAVVALFFIVMLTYIYNRTTGGSVQAGSNIIITGGVRSAQINLEVLNVAEDAFQASVTIVIPFQLEFGRITGTFQNDVSTQNLNLHNCLFYSHKTGHCVQSNTSWIMYL